MNMISVFRRRAGLSQTALGKKLGWRQTRIGNYETGYRLPTIYDARALAAALTEVSGSPVSLDDLFPPEVQDQSA